MTGARRGAAKGSGCAPWDDRGLFLLRTAGGSGNWRTVHDQLRESALADLPGTVYRDDAGIREGLQRHRFSASRIQRNAIHARDNAAAKGLETKGTQQDP
jgi:hypothetical protein